MTPKQQKALDKATKELNDIIHNLISKNPKINDITVNSNISFMCEEMANYIYNLQDKLSELAGRCSIGDEELCDMVEAIEKGKHIPSRIVSHIVESGE